MADKFEDAIKKLEGIVGKVWESRSGGRCLFVMPTEEDFSTISKAIL